MQINDHENVGVYLRQSYDRALMEAAKKTSAKKAVGAALARQEASCHRTIDYHSAQEADRGGKPWKVIETYSENHVSAAAGKKRGEFERMLADIDAGRITILVAHHMDRLTRNARDTLRLLETCERHGVQIFTGEGGLDLNSPMGKMILTILAAVAQAEIERKSERQALAAAQQAEQGRPAQGRRKFGYQAGNMVPDPEEAERVRAAFEGVLAGRSMMGIIAEWNQAGVTTVTGEPWTLQKLRYVLRNPFYAGLRFHKDELVGQGIWEPIVSEESWRAVRGILDEPSRRTNTEQGTARRWVLSGLARCGVCGDGTTVKTARRNPGKGRPGTRVYTCRTGKHLTRAAEGLDAYVTDVILDRLSRGDAEELLHDEERPDVEALRGELLAARARRDRLDHDYYVSGKLSSEARYESLVRQVEATIEELEAKLSHTDRAPVLVDLVRAAEPRQVWEGLGLDRKRAVIDALATVTLFKGRPGAVKGFKPVKGSMRPIDPDTVVVDFHRPVTG